MITLFVTLWWQQQYQSAGKAQGDSVTGAFRYVAIFQFMFAIMYGSFLHPTYEPMDVMRIFTYVSFGLVALVSIVDAVMTESVTAIAVPATGRSSSSHDDAVSQMSSLALICVSQVAVYTAVYGMIEEGGMDVPGTRVADATAVIVHLSWIGMGLAFLCFSLLRTVCNDDNSNSDGAQSYGRAASVVARLGTLICTLNSILILEESVTASPELWVAIVLLGILLVFETEQSPMSFTGSWEAMCDPYLIAYVTLLAVYAIVIVARSADESRYATRIGVFKWPLPIGLVCVCCSQLIRAGGEQCGGGGIALARHKGQR